MTEFWQSFIPGWSGWLFMWILLLTAAIMIALVVERARYVFAKANVHAARYMSQIRQLIKNGDLKQAVSLSKRLEDKAGRKPGATGQEIQAAMDEAALEVVPKLQARTGYLSMIGNISTLIGLMGTIYGLILSFRSVSAPGIDAAEKSRLLAHGIAVAMNTTLFGLAVAIPAIIAYTILHNKTNQIIDEIDEHSVKLVNMMAREE